jgi:hypothetical protein
MNPYTEALFRKLESLSDVPIGQLSGKMGAIIDLVSDNFKLSD